jgi:glycosyltransferase involved in cell wall biosynthesis
MIEAMACGTPVIAFNQGAVPEVIRDGKTGFIIENVEQAVHVVAHLDTIDRAVVRATFERRFSVDVMAEKYEGAYADIIARNDTRRLRIAATKVRKLAQTSAFPPAVPVIPLAGRA